MPSMFDSANPANLPELTPDNLILYPVNGMYGSGTKYWNDTVVEKYTSAGHPMVPYVIYIPAQIPPDDGLVLDIEAEDVGYMSKVLAREWIAKRKAAGVARPTIYTSKSGLVTLGDLDCDFGIADPDVPEPHLLPGTVFTQWGFFGKYDISEVINGWPYNQGGNVSGPASPCGGVKLTSTGKGYWLFGQDGGVFAYGDAQMMGNPTKDLPTGEKIVGFDSVVDEGYIMVSDRYNTYSYGNAPVLGHP